MPRRPWYRRRIEDRPSLTGKYWRLCSKTPLGSVGSLVEKLCAARGLPQPGTETGLGLASPLLLPDMPRAVERIERAVAAREPVAIFGDYDCDGVTGTAQLVRYFRRRGIEPHVRLPHRVNDGYGLKKHIIEECKAQGSTLLITVDTGITAVEEIARAAEGGIDVIVTDHHHSRPELPPAYAIIHPFLAPRYPLPYPSGAGVAFQLVRALERTAWEGLETDVALAMIGTVADLVELRGDNRSLVRYGLQSLQKIAAGPLAALADGVARPGVPITSTDVAFRIAPRINAAGRMADPMIALHALLEGGAALEQLEALNAERRKATDALLETAFDSCGARNEDAPLFLVAASAEYPHGIIGLIAGNLTEATGKPSLVASIDGDMCIASLRSSAAYHVTEGLGRCSDLLLRFGGHAQAAGCTFPAANLNLVRERLNADVAEHADIAALRPSLLVDAMLDAEQVTLALCEELTALEPFGQGNLEPRFLIENVILDQIRTVGTDDAHLQARLEGLKTIGFRLGSLKEHTKEPVDLVCRIGIDSWQGRRVPQLFIEDMRLSVPVAVVAY